MKSVSIKAEPRIGDIWNVDLSPPVGREHAKIPRGSVISHDRFNQLRNGLHIVVPIAGTDRGLAYHVRILPPGGGLTKSSQIMCEQVKSQGVSRFIKRRGVVSSRTLPRVQEIVAELIDR